MIMKIVFWSDHKMVGFSDSIVLSYDDRKSPSPIYKTKNLPFFTLPIPILFVMIKEFHL